MFSIKNSKGNTKLTSCRGNCAYQYSRKKEMNCVEKDEHPRRNSNLENLLILLTPFCENGSITTGNSFGVNDGAVAMMVSYEKNTRKKS